MNTYTLLSRRVASCATVCFITAHAPFASSQDSESEEVFELSPFTVDVSGDEGWRASSTLTGSRTNQELKNVPLSVDALTAEFMEDLGIYTLEDAGNYIAGLDTVPDDERRNDNGSTAFRGMSLGGRENAASSRNNFLWYPRTDNYNVSRIDFNKGSNSLMFGDASPGGQATVYTKRAQFRNFGSITGQYGSYGSNRMMLDVNRKITEKLALRINAVDKAARSYIDFGNDYLRGIDLAGTFKATENTTFRFEVEDMRFERIRAQSALAVNQVAADGLGFSSTSRNYFTTDGDYVDSRARNVYLSDGNGGFQEPFTIDSDDRRRGATGDDLTLYEGSVQQVLGYASSNADREPFITVGPVTPAINVYGVRSFIERDINNYTFAVEQSVGDLNIEFAANLQEQFQFRNDNDFSTAISVDGNGRLYNDTDLDKKYFGNDVNTVRLTASYPLEIGENISQFFVANVTYLDDEAYSFRNRLINKAKAIDPDTGEYDVTHDGEGRDRIRVRGYYDGGDPTADLRNSSAWDSLRPENLPNIPGVFEPMWVAYTTANKPYTDKRYSKSASLSTNGTYFNGRLRSLLGVREDEFTLKRYKLPGGSIADRVAEFGEIAWWGQDVYVGSPDEFPDFYEHVPELNQTSTTYSAGLVFQVNDSVNLYGNNSTSFRWQGTEDFLGRIIGAQEGETRELGLKADFLENKFSVSGAVYEIDRGNVAFRVSSPGSAAIERLFNDTIIEISPDGELIYLDPEPSDPGYQVTGMGLNQEHRQITASEFSTGYELTLMMARTAGLQARVAISHTDVTSNVDLEDYAEQVRLAEGRVATRQAIIDQYWASDPSYEEGTLPDAENSLRDDLEDVQQALVDNAGEAKIVGSRGRPYMASWILDYKFGENFVLPELRVLLSGRYADNYLMSVNDGVDWFGGSTHPVSLSFNWKTQIKEYPVDFRFKITDLHDFENTEIREFNGFVDQTSGLETWRLRNIRPTSYDLSATLKF